MHWVFVHRMCVLEPDGGQLVSLHVLLVLWSQWAYWNWDALLLFLNIFTFGCATGFMCNPAPFCRVLVLVVTVGPNRKKCVLATQITGGPCLVVLFRGSYRRAYIAAFPYKR